MVDFEYDPRFAGFSVFLRWPLALSWVRGLYRIRLVLSGQIDTLRESRDSLRDELSATQEQLAGSDSALDVAGGELLPNTLTGRNIAIVVLPGVDSDAVSQMIESLELAGASVSGTGDTHGRLHEL